MMDERKTREQLTRKLAEMGKEIVRLKIIEEERKGTEEALNLYRDMVIDMAVGLYVYHLEDIGDDTTLRLIEVNPAAERFTGVAGKDALGNTLDENFPGLREQGVPQLYAEVVRSGKPLELGDILYNDERVEQNWFSVRAFPLPGNCMGVSFDKITERKRIEEALRNNEEKYRSLTENIPGMVYSAKADWSIDIISNCERVSGYSIEEFSSGGVNWLDLVVTEDRDRISMEGAKLLEKATPIVQEYRITSKDGTIRWVTDHKNSFFSEDGRFRGIDGVVFDITERKRLEEERFTIEDHLRRSQKLQSIGTLAGGVAHEINNPLMGIINYAQLIHDRIPDEKLKQFASGIIKEGNRIDAIVKNLISFARQDNQRHSLARLEDIIDASLGLIGSLLRKDEITIEKDIPGDLPKVRCRSQQIEQAIINLLTNARDALNSRYEGCHENKVIRIRVRPFEKEGGKWLRTTVEDHGVGMSRDTIDRIFDPFFTTKPRDVSIGRFGTGLGLAISHGIIEDHGGEVWAESEVGEYTRFHMDLRVDNGWVLEGTGTENGSQDEKKVEE